MRNGFYIEKPWKPGVLRVGNDSPNILLTFTGLRKSGIQFLSAYGEAKTFLARWLAAGFSQ
jgi:hypothetical protein